MVFLDGFYHLPTYLARLAALAIQFSSNSIYSITTFLAFAVFFHLESFPTHTLDLLAAVQISV